MSVYDKESPLAKKTIEGDDHYSLMIQISEMLPVNSTLVLTDAVALGKVPLEAVSLADRFLDKHIHLEFLNSPWMNSKNIELLLKLSPHEARNSYISMLTETIQWKTEPADKYRIIDPSITQASSKVKKNGI